MIQILSTKTLLSNQREALVNANFNVIEADFIKTKSNPFQLNEINENLIFTSQNAVQSFLLDPRSEALKSKNVFCVGLKTKIMLSESGYNVVAYTGNEIQVYETTLTPQKIKTPVEAILFFSPSGIESYLKENKIKNETCFCIGTTTASALEGITKNIVVADQPTIEDVIEEVIAEYK